ncbi:hypothetical protein [Methanobacterium alcaliphilum]|uniref:hypothetical protein n=1 Tax=Methanobacterium alcaliphilum TaxID=392018 RepID=UPI002009F2F4|nr:hypothetical protein [Methanobacterium alcaliphilum]
MLAIVFIPLGVYLESQYPQQKPAEIAGLKLGDTVMPGTDVIDENKIRKVPVVSNIHYIIDYAEEGRFGELLEALLTGIVRTPIAKITGDNISRYGISTNYTGPGMLAVKANKLIVKAPDNFIWGYKTTYTYGVKTDNGLEILENNKTVKTVSYDDINNNSVPTQYKSADVIKKWYKDARKNETIGLEYSLTSFNDGRNTVVPSKIKEYFGQEVVDYMGDYQVSSPIMVYMHSYTESTISKSYTNLGSFPELNDAARSYNARAFAQAWNGTIVPPHTTISGKETVGFTSSRDPEAPGGSASHGMCPPSRVLRGIVTSAGLPRPYGITWAHNAIPFGIYFSDISVTNTADYPVRVEMWTTNSGYQIYGKLVKYSPN